VSPEADGEGRFIRPTKTDAVFNRVVGTLTRLGLPLAGSRVLAVRGSASGVLRTTAVWGWVVGRFFEGVSADSSEARLLEIAPGFPVFRSETRA